MLIEILIAILAGVTAGTLTGVIRSPRTPKTIQFGNIYMQAGKFVVQ